MLIRLRVDPSSSWKQTDGFRPLDDSTNRCTFRCRQSGDGRHAAGPKSPRHSKRIGGWEDRCCVPDPAGIFEQTVADAPSGMRKIVHSFFPETANEKPGSPSRCQGSDCKPRFSDLLRRRSCARAPSTRGLGARRRPPPHQ